MSRVLTPAMLSAIGSSALKPVRLVALHFDGGSQYHTTAYKEITWSGNVYQPGNLMSIGSVPESLALRVPTLKIVLSGSNQANFATALLENAIDREVVLSMGLLDSNEILVIDPVEEFRGRLDSYQIKEDPSSGTNISWSCVSQLQDFNRISGRIANDDDQQSLFPGDNGFAFAAVVARDIKWGRA